MPSSEIWMVTILGTLSAILTGTLIILLVYAIPIDKQYKLVILFALGCISILIGYLVLIKMPPNVNNKMAVTNNPNGHSHDSRSGCKDINNKFSHIPIEPKITNVIKNMPIKNN